MAIFIVISIVIISALFSAENSLKDKDHPVITGILAAPFFLGIKYLIVWGIFALVNLFTPLAYTSIAILTFAVISGVISLFLKVIALYLEDKVN